MADIAVLPKRSTLASYQRRKEIGQILRKLREAVGIDCMTAGVRAGVSVHTWERWEAGRTAIPLDRIPDIRKALKGRNPLTAARKQLGVAA